MTHQMANIPELDDRLNAQPFIIYRPDRISERLEGTYHTNREFWRPSLSYKHTLRDIRNQFTPAEYFRHQLATRGAEIRAIQRLQLRIDRNPDVFNRAASIVQGLYRGRKGRRQFAIIKEELILEKFRREAKAAAVTAFDRRAFEEAIVEVDKLDPPEVEYLVIKIKSLYRLGKCKECISTAKTAIGECLLNQLMVAATLISSFVYMVLVVFATWIDMDAMCETAYYMQACAWVVLNRIDAAYEVMKMLMTNIEQPMRDSYKLAAYAAAFSSPPLFTEAVDSYSALINQDAKDFEAVSDCISMLYLIQIDY